MKRKPQRPRIYQLHRAGKPLPRSTFARIHSAQSRQLYAAWYQSLPGDVFEIVDRRTGRVHGPRLRASTHGVYTVK